VFLLFNIALGAYILGTITLLVVKNDERTGEATAAGPVSAACWKFTLQVCQV
jgi:hypothetical protein